MKRRSLEILSMPWQLCCRYTCKIFNDPITNYLRQPFCFEIKIVIVVEWASSLKVMFTFVMQLWMLHCHSDKHFVHWARFVRLSIAHAISSVVIEIQIFVLPTPRQRGISWRPWQQQILKNMLCIYTSIEIRQEIFNGNIGNFTETMHSISGANFTNMD